VTAALLWLLLYTHPFAPVLDAIAEQESGNNWLAKNGSHIGAYQVSRRNVRYPWPLLYLGPIGRVQALRVLAKFRRRGGTMHNALEGYRWGYAGAYGETDGLYAKCVAARMITHRTGAKRIRSCKEVPLLYDTDVLAAELRRY